MDMRTSVESINNSQMFNFALKNLRLNNQSKNFKLSSNAEISKDRSSSNSPPSIKVDKVKFVSPSNEKLRQ